MFFVLFCCRVINIMLLNYKVNWYYFAKKSKNCYEKAVFLSVLIEITRLRR